jgi:hypothetical protein
MKSKNILLPIGVLVSLGFSFAGCNTTKATTDTLIRFTGSTTPGDLFTADGLIKAQHKALFFTALNHQNLQHDIAQGHGEYLTSLSTLLNIPVNRQNDFYRLAQEQYADLYPSDDTTPTQTLTALLSAWSR